VTTALRPDAEREWAYDKTAFIGRLDKALDEAKEKGWTMTKAKEWFEKSKEKKETKIKKKPKK